jgi:hypothetical protein
MQRRLILVGLAGLVVSACKKPVASQVLPAMLVHKSEGCACCEGWVQHMRQAGFEVQVRDESNLNDIKARVGVPVGKGSCHTTEVGGYFLEGHVPAQDVQRLLSERPAGKGLVLAGMPLGSPGMEAPDGSVQPYTVELVLPSGETVAFAHHGGSPGSSRSDSA